MAKKFKIPAGADQRAASAERIIPPAPLPHVSRRALARVANPLPAPTCCPYCSGAVELVSNSAIYRREYGNWPFAYLCRQCGAYVGLHPDTDIPLGTLANAELRVARQSSKSLFHEWMEASDMGRSEAYRLLAGRLGIPVGECHFGWFDLDQCAQAKAVLVAAATALHEANR